MEGGKCALSSCHTEQGLVGRGEGGGNGILGSVTEVKWLLMKDSDCSMETEILRYYTAQCAARSQCAPTVMGSAV
jgi:hypothetical protein